MVNSKDLEARWHGCKSSSCNLPWACYLLSLTQFPPCKRGPMVIDNTYVVRMRISSCELPELSLGHNKLAVIRDSCYRLFTDRGVRG